MKSLEEIFESDSAFLLEQLAPELTMGRRGPSAPVKAPIKMELAIRIVHLIHIGTLFLVGNFLSLSTESLQ